MTDFGDSSGRRPGSPRGPATSRTLLDLAKAGDAHAWRQLVFLYRPLVRWWCRRGGVRQQHNLEDLTQDVFHAVTHSITTFRVGPQGSFRGWLSQITQYKIADHYRREWKAPKARGGSDAQADFERVAAGTVAPDTDEEIVTERTVLIRRAFQLVRPEFKPRSWEAAWQVVVEERSRAEVADELRMTAGAVYTAKSRVLRRLREVLEDLGVRPAEPGPAAPPGGVHE